MKKVGFVIGLVVVLVGVILFYPKSDNQKILVEDHHFNQNTSLAFYIEQEDGTYTKSNTLPSTGYTLNTSKSVCSNGAIPTWDDNKLYFNNLTKNGTSCYLYFDIKPTAANTILVNSTVHEGTPDFSQAATTDEGMYKTEDDLGTSYYFRGSVENNYVKFAGYYWRIIRINGDGSIRIIYDGTTAHANGESSTDRQIGTSAYNSLYNASYYVGYTYQANAQRPSSQNSGTASTIKGVLDNWYTMNIINKGYDDKVVSTPGFCNDRNMANGYNWVASSSTINYAAFERLVENRLPILKCNNILDLYTTKVGLIIADEVSMAGGVYYAANKINRNYYLYIGIDYWTMTPGYFGGGYANMLYIDSDGRLHYYWFINNTTLGVRPVINLSSDVTLTGSGTMSDPYVVEGAE